MRVLAGGYGVHSRSSGPAPRAPESSSKAIENSRFSERFSSIYQVFGVVRLFMNGNILSKLFGRLRLAAKGPPRRGGREEEALREAR